jgi:hypothetical protein
MDEGERNGDGANGRNGDSPSAFTRPVSPPAALETPGTQRKAPRMIDPTPTIAINSVKTDDLLWIQNQAHHSETFFCFCLSVFSVPPR